MKRCRDRNIVQFLGSAVDREQALLVTEFMEAGDLHSALRRDAGGALLWYRRRVSLAVARKQNPFCRMFLRSGRQSCLDWNTGRLEDRPSGNGCLGHGGSRGCELGWVCVACRRCAWTAPDVLPYAMH